MQAMKQPVTLENFNFREAKMFLLSGELWLVISIAIRIGCKHSYLEKAQTEVYEELNKHINVMYAYKTTSRITSARKYKLINCLHLSGCLHLSRYLSAIQN